MLSAPVQEALSIDQICPHARPKAAGNRTRIPPPPAWRTSGGTVVTRALDACHCDHETPGLVIGLELFTIRSATPAQGRDKPGALSQFNCGLR